MNFKLTGIILFTENYLDCVDFYQDKLGLPVLFSKADLTCFRFGDAYLMVEMGGVSSVSPKELHQNPTILRLNVADIETTAAELRERGVDVKISYFDWGVVGSFHDPDGNLCELKDHESLFEFSSG